MTAKLKKLRIDRVDFVDQGANPGAHITLAKRATTEEPHMADQKESEAAFEKRLKAMEDAQTALQKRAETAEAEAKAAVAKQEETAKALAKALDTQETKECESIAKGLTVPGVKDKVAFVKGLRASESGVEALKVIQTLTKQVAEGALFEELGSDNGTPVLKGYQRLEQMADEFVTAGKAKNTAEGIQKAMATPEGKAAYAEYQSGLVRKGA